jgi:hypothetical protein
MKAFVKYKGVVDCMNTRHASFRFEKVPIHVAMTCFT